ncbi:DUF2550 domain-containing protein [Streptomyces sp. JJ36]|uniref:DUF2550 domain-containing protein n=1 Tax=Streptomyces sp. JJ36 TaxID=2736645 RepID=UPI001F1FB333|nr:DUF2550 domain-containing protein [Streptomyces sp. JJ36]MCF6521602.1 DUF2550 domain-containing protein [Streptomyces sp. JJ36]
MVLALLLCGAVLVLVLVGLFVFGLRRRLIQRSGGTFDCSLRWNVPADEPGTDGGGKGWVYGVARYNGDQVNWFRVFSYSPRPRRTLERGGIEVLARRRPTGEEELALLSDQVILACTVPRGTRVELAMSEDALTGFLAWLEAAPPGQRVNVA